LTIVGASSAGAQGLDDVAVRGFVNIGNLRVTATDSFEAVLDRSSGLIFGGGGQVLLPWNVYLEVGVWRFKQTGERVFIGPDDEVFRLGIPLDVSITPIEITGGYRFTMLSARFTPYAGAGYSSYRYRETSEFAEPDENVDERLSGVHVQAGAEYRIAQWLAIGGEVGWSSVPDGIGQGGVSARFGEDNLGGSSVRLKISFGQ
jgi:hypothetical protein